MGEEKIDRCLRGFPLAGENFEHREPLPSVTWNEPFDAMQIGLMSRLL